MPAVTMHLYVPQLVRKHLARRRPSNHPYQTLVLESLDDAGEPRTIALNQELVSLIENHFDSFCAGAIAPDFFPDVFWGMTISHQPYRHSASLADYMQALADSLDFAEQAHVAFAFGWLTHYCVDVFCHHWVGMESGGDFETWLSTPPEVMRKHIGIEMLWDKTVPNFAKTFTVTASFLRSLMLTKDSKLCKTFYNDQEYQEIFALIQLVELAAWHHSKEVAIADFQAHCSQADQSKRCPRCAGTAFVINCMERGCEICGETGRISQIVERNCATCNGIGTVSKAIEKSCPQCAATGVVSKLLKEQCDPCGASGQIEKRCPTCRGAGRIKEPIRRCALCRGSGRIDCRNCHGSGSVKVGVRGFKRTVPCPTCLGTKGIPCPHDAGETVVETLMKTCPLCDGAKVVRKTCPTCKGLKCVQRTIEETCPICHGAKALREAVQVTCPVCQGAKIIHATVEVICTTCQGLKKIVTQGRLPCPVCTPAFLTLHRVCDCLTRYHRRRREAALAVVDRYLEAHTAMVHCLLEDRMSQILDGFKEFWSAFESLAAMETSFADLIAPEYGDLEEQVRSFVETQIAEPLKELIPTWIVEIPRKAFEQATSVIAEKLGLLLRDAEKEHYRTLWSSYASVEEFPPLRNAITLYLLALDGCSPDMHGLLEATKSLGRANNIDRRCQPFSIMPFTNPEFPWDRYFAPFLNPEDTNQHCLRDGFTVERPHA